MKCYIFCQWDRDGFCCELATLFGLLKHCVPVSSVPVIRDDWLSENVSDTAPEFDTVYDGYKGQPAGLAGRPETSFHLEFQF